MPTDLMIKYDQYSDLMISWNALYNALEDAQSVLARVGRDAGANRFVQGYAERAAGNAAIALRKGDAS